eukprot:2790779-Prymnesium_polylepis.1
MATSHWVPLEPSVARLGVTAFRRHCPACWRSARSVRKSTTPPMGSGRHVNYTISYIGNSEHSKKSR